MILILMVRVAWFQWSSGRMPQSSWALRVLIVLWFTQHHDAVGGEIWGVEEFCRLLLQAKDITYLTQLLFLIF